MRYNEVMQIAIEERFWRFVAPMMDDRGCWEWSGNRTPKGYGQMASHRQGHPVMAHRVSYQIHSGPIPEGMCILHKCDNRSCVNPTHLRVGTYADNTRDMYDKGRHRGTTLTHCTYGHARADFGYRKSTVSTTYSGKPRAYETWKCRKCDSAHNRKQTLKRKSAREKNHNALG